MSYGAFLSLLPSRSFCMLHPSPPIADSHLANGQVALSNFEPLTYWYRSPRKEFFGRGLGCSIRPTNSPPSFYSHSFFYGGIRWSCEWVSACASLIVLPIEFLSYLPSSIFIICHHQTSWIGSRYVVYISCLFHMLVHAFYGH